MNTNLILDYLEKIANNNIPASLAAHIITMAALIILLVSSQNKLRTKAVAFALFFIQISVATIAFVNGNPFHLAIFTMLTLISALELVRADNSYINVKLDFNTAVSLLMIIIGLVYPEFVKASAWQMMFISPLGIAPCPTLLVSFGLVNLAFPRAAKLQYISILSASIIFGFIGTFALKVSLDATLLAAAAYGTARLATQMYSNRAVKSLISNVLK